MLVGNKCDMESAREVPAEVGKKYADRFGMPFFETSAKLKTNVAEAFLQVVREILKHTPDLKAKKKLKRERRYCTMM